MAVRATGRGSREQLLKTVEALAAQRRLVAASSSKGDHEIWFHPDTRRKVTVDHKIKSRHTANDILKDAGLPKAF